jgi:methyl coenzyme M reductase subunit C
MMKQAYGLKPQPPFGVKNEIISKTRMAERSLRSPSREVCQTRCDLSPFARAGMVQPVVNEVRLKFDLKASVKVRACRCWG